MTTIWTTPLVPGVTFEVAVVTPEMAQAFLEKIDKQRSISAPRFNRYSLDMATNLWLFTGDPFRFDENDAFIDGQHRARAIIESGEPQVVLIIRGLTKEAMKVLDIGGKRTFANLLQMAEIPNASLVASITKAHFLWTCGLYGHRNIPYQVDPPREGVDPSHSELWAHFGANTTLITAATAANRIWGTTNRQSLTRTLIGLAWMVMGEIDPYKRDEFWHEVTTDTPSQTYPEFAPSVLHDRVSRRVTFGTPAIPHHGQLAIIFRSWNAWITGEKLRVLKVPSSMERRYLPVPIDPNKWNPDTDTDVNGENE